MSLKKLFNKKDSKRNHVGFDDSSSRSKKNKDGSSDLTVTGKPKAVNLGGVDYKLEEFFLNDSFSTSYMLRVNPLNIVKVKKKDQDSNWEFAIKENPYIYLIAPRAIRKELELARESVKHDPFTYSRLSASLQKEESILLDAMQSIEAKGTSLYSDVSKGISDGSHINEDKLKILQDVFNMQSAVKNAQSPSPRPNRMSVPTETPEIKVIKKGGFNKSVAQDSKSMARDKKPEISVKDIFMSDLVDMESALRLNPPLHKRPERKVSASEIIAESIVSSVDSNLSKE